MPPLEFIPLAEETGLIEALGLWVLNRACTDAAGWPAMGVSIAMDDFGTGYSSLAYLWRFPFHKVKVDRAFTQNLDDDPKVNLTVSSIIAGLPCPQRQARSTASAGRTASRCLPTCRWTAKQAHRPGMNARRTGVPGRRQSRSAGIGSGPAALPATTSLARSAAVATLAFLPRAR